MVDKDKLMGVTVLSATPDTDAEPSEFATQVRQRFEEYMVQRSAFLRSVDKTTRARMSGRPDAPVFSKG